MKFKSIFLALLIVGGVFFLMAGNASAAAAWYDCSVDMVGPAWGTMYVILDDLNGAFTDKWYVLDPAQANQMMAAVLTQMSGGTGTIKVYVDPEGGDYPVIYALYFSPE
jgi:hypothetical protein